MFRSFATLAFATVVSAVQLQPEQLPANHMYLTEVHNANLDLGGLTEAEIKQSFDLFDKDKSGTITVAELGAVMKSMGQNPTKAELAGMMKEIDTDGNGTVNFTEFLQLIKSQMKAQTTPTTVEDNSEKEDKAAFREIDKDGDGVINRADLTKFMKEIMGTDPPTAMVDGILT